MASPSPVPSPGGLEVKKGSKTRSRSASGIPLPLSETTHSTPSGVRRSSALSASSPERSRSGAGRTRRITRGSASVGHRVSGVEDEVEQDLRDGARIRQDWRLRTFALDLEADAVVTPLRRDQGDGLVGEHRQVQAGWRCPRRAGKVQELPEDRADPPSLVARPIQMGPGGFGDLRIARRQIQQGEDCADRISDLVGHASREPTHRRQPLGPIQTRSSPPQVPVRRPQLHDRLLERPRAVLQGVGHGVEGAPHVGDLARPCDGSAGGERPLRDLPSRCREPLERQHDPAAQQVGPKAHEDQDVSHHHRRHHPQWNRAEAVRSASGKTPRHHPARPVEGGGEANRFPDATGHEQWLRPRQGPVGELSRLGVDHSPGRTAWLDATVARYRPPLRAREQRIGQGPGRTRLGEERAAENRAESGLLLGHEDRRQDQSREAHHQGEAEEDFGLNPGAARHLLYPSPLASGSSRPSFSKR